LTERLLASGRHVVATSRSGALPMRHPLLAVLQLDPADREACRRASICSARCG
jgi:hypothetical protein